MPGGPDYPHDHSAKYPLAARDAVRPVPANDNIQGIIHTPEGDIRAWVIAASVKSSHRDLVTALAYLDIADRTAAEHNAAINAEVAHLRNEVQRLQGAVEASAGQVQALVNFLGVIVPAWRNREEIESGDDMGMDVPSAASIGLAVEIIPLQLEPGFGHEEVVSMEPAAGTLIARGGTVRVRMNFLG